MAENPTEVVGLSENRNLPAPDLPSLASVDGGNESPFVSLQHISSDIQIRQQEIHLATTNNMVLPRFDYGNTLTTHLSNMQNIHGAVGTNHLLMHEITDRTQFHPRRETSANYTLRLGTFHHWPHRFLDPAVLAEAKFCYTGRGDTVQCTVCRGELSNWAPGDDPRQQHLSRFGFSCR